MLHINAEAGSVQVFEALLPVLQVAKSFSGIHYPVSSSICLLVRVACSCCIPMYSYRLVEKYGYMQTISCLLLEEKVADKIHKGQGSLQWRRAVLPDPWQRQRPVSWTLIYIFVQLGFGKNCALIYFSCLFNSVPVQSMSVLVQKFGFYVIWATSSSVCLTTSYRINFAL